MSDVLMITYAISVQYHYTTSMTLASI